MNRENKERYVAVLQKAMEHGLELLEKQINIEDELFQRVVVNINNSGNIVMQLQADMDAEDAGYAKENTEE